MQIRVDFFSCYTGKYRYTMYDNWKEVDYLPGMLQFC